MPCRIFIALMLALQFTGSAFAQDFQKGMEASRRGDYATAMREWRPLAESGNAKAQFQVGFAYQFGRGVTRDYAEAMRWYREAARRGHAEANRNIGRMYQSGQGVSRDHEEALRWFHKAAELGHVPTQYMLARRYRLGIGVPKDYAESVRWYRRLAEQGHARAQTSLGIMYANGQGVAKDISEAIKWYLKAAEQGEPTAQNNLGLTYVRAPMRNYAKAMMWFRRAAEQDHASATYSLGIMHDKGHGVPRDHSKAMSFYCMAAELGSKHAMRELDNWVIASIWFCPRQSSFGRYFRRSSWLKALSQCAVPSLIFLGLIVTSIIVIAFRYYSYRRKQEEKNLQLEQLSAGHNDKETTKFVPTNLSSIIFWILFIILDGLVLVVAFWVVGFCFAWSN